jgi:hypothetical protein
MKPETTEQPTIKVVNPELVAKRKELDELKRKGETLLKERADAYQAYSAQLVEVEREGNQVFGVIKYLEAQAAQKKE